jgi:PgaD-like protein
MTDQPLTSPKAWPPLIVASTKPTWVKVRDIALTVLMWVLFAIMLETEFEVIHSRNMVRLGLSDVGDDWRWPEFFQALLPFVQVALVLVSLLLIAGLLSLLRLARERKLPQPAPLPAGDEASRVGLEEANLVAARELRIVVAHIDKDGGYRVNPQGTTTLDAEQAPTNR